MSKIQTKDIFEPSWAVAQLELREEVKKWIKAAIRRQSGIPWRGVHDEANYTNSWPNYYKLSGDEAVKSFLVAVRDSYREWSKIHEFHGFHASAKDHITHTFENAEGFISSLYYLDADDPVNQEIIEDIAHHVGNWEEGIPAWYDWDKHMFVSHWLGTKAVKNYEPYDFDATHHSRVGSLLITAYKISGKERYIDWCKDWVGMWLDLIMESQDRIPGRVYPRKMSLEECKRIYSYDKKDFGDPYLEWPNRTAKLVSFILDVYAIVREPSYLDAFHKAMQLYEGNLELQRMAVLIQKYEKITGDMRYHDKLVQWFENELAPLLNTQQSIPELLITGINTRRAYGVLNENGDVKVYRGPNPVMLNTGFGITGNLEYLKRAMVLSSRQLSLVAWATRDGWEHGCAGNQYLHGCGGEAAGVLYSSTGIGKMKYYKNDGSLGLEEGVAVLCDPSDNNMILYLYNNNEDKKYVKVAFENKTCKFDAIIIDDNLDGQSHGNMILLELQPGKVHKVEIKI